MSEQKPRLRISTRRKGGRKESIHVTSRGTVTAGLIFYLSRNDRGVVGSIRRCLKITTQNQWEQSSPPQSTKIEDDHVFFQTEFPDKEHASNGPFIEYLAKTAGLRENHPVKQRLKELKYELTKLKLRGVTSIETVFDVHNTLT